MVVEATVMPDEVERLVQELVNRDKPKSEESNTVSVPQDVQVETKSHPFMDALVHCQNQLDSVDGVWETGNREQMIAFLQKTQKYLDAHQPARTEGFWSSVYQCESMRVSILLDLLHIDNLDKQGRRILAKSKMVEVHKKAAALKADVNQLKTYTRLTEKQKSTRDTTINRCKRTMNRVSNKSEEFRKS
jgi:hypothetical protein